MPARIRFDQLFAIGLVSLFLLLLGLVPAQSVSIALAIPQPVEVTVAAVSAIPLSSQAWLTLDSGRIPNPIVPLQLSDITASITAQSALVTDVTTGTTLFDHQSQQLGFPASTVKLMTALVALEKYSPETLLTVTSADISSNSLPVFTVGEQLTVIDLVKALLVSSSNTAAQVLAREYPNGYEGFIERMNQKAFELGMTHTKFVDPVGFDWTNQQSTARDLEIVSQTVMQQPVLADIVKQSLVIISDFSGTRQHTLLSTNRLLLANPTEVVGIKTGTTPSAGEVLISQFQLADRSIRIVVLGSQDRYQDTLTLLDTIQQKYVWIQPQDMLAQLGEVALQ